MSFHKLQSFRNDKYLKFIRTRPCTITRAEGHGVVAHHIRCLGGGGTNLKPSDYLCVPLTAEEHAKLHHVGEKRYWAEHNVDPLEEILLNLIVFLTVSRAGREYDTAFGIIGLLENLRGH